MGKKSKLMTLAVVYCVIVCGTANILYYGAKYGFNLIMFSLAIKNIISSFTLTAGLSLTELISNKAIITGFEAYPAFIKTDIFATGLVNAYALSSAIAPMCTASALIISARIFFRKLFAKKDVGSDRTVIFGYNTKVKSAIQGEKNITIIARDPITAKEENDLRKNNIHFRVFDVASEKKENAVAYLKKLAMEKVKRILILDDSDAANFSIYQRLAETDISFENDCIIKAECSNVLIQKLFINAYQNKKKLPIILFSSRSLTANGILNQYPVYREISPDDDDVRILIIGFGKTGQQICQRIVNEAQVNAGSRLYIDVVDRSIEKDKVEFLSLLSGTYGQFLTDRYVLTDPETDGRLEIVFRQFDVSSFEFTEFLKKQDDYDYCTVITGNSDSALEAIIQINETVKACKRETFPIIACNDRSDEVIRYINEDTDLYRNIHFVKKTGSVDMIFRETDEQDIIDFYNHYDDYNIITENNEEEDADELIKTCEWNSLDFYKQNRIRQMYNHQKVKRYILQTKYGDDIKSLLKERFGKNGTIFQKKGTQFTFNGSVNDVLRLIEEDGFSRDCMILEQRRWCTAMAFDGWSCGEKTDPAAKTSPWLCDCDTLKARQPEVLLYRLKPLLYMMDRDDKK